jgi:hypothetical protein
MLGNPPKDVLRPISAYAKLARLNTQSLCSELNRAEMEKNLKMG